MQEIKRLNLRANQLTTPELEAVVFPVNLEKLWLESNGLTTLDGIVFPLNLKELYLSLNELTTLEGVIFPPNLEILHLKSFV